MQKNFVWLDKITCENADVKPPLRNILAESHISAITIAVLLFWSLNAAFHALWSPLFRVAKYLFTAVAILGIPYSGTITFEDRVMLFATISYLFSALVSFAAAWLLARWVYGDGPLRSLSRYSNRIARKNHA